MKKILYLMFVALLTVMAGTAWGQTNPDRTLGNIPTDWTVKVNGSSVTVTDGTVTIPAGATVTLTPTYPAKVKSVKLKDEGLLKGKFTVNAGGKQVYFSQGNLQAVCSSADDDASTQETWTWQFATNQWDYVGYSIANTSINGNGSVFTTGTVDLFGWVGTSSSYDNYGIHNNTTASDYGNTSNESLKHDWGHNAIANGGNSADMWRTLTRDEWWYMLNMRSGATVNGTDNVRFAKATIRTDETAVKGVILFPDGTSFEASEASWNDLNNGYKNYTTTCTAAQWTALEAKGCVFLPAASIRTGATVSNESSTGAYWTATGSNQSGYYTWAHMVYFNQNTWSTSSSYKEKSYGLSVRLVKDAQIVNLSTLMGNYEAQNGDILIGTLAGNYKISIADGATVTLRNATINGTNNNSYQWAGITCLGDATIVLEGTNTVTGFHHWYPGIQAAHNGTGSGDEYTLTIKGTGSLNASSNGYAAGIGGGYVLACGNIAIESGTITSTGSGGGAGIGGGSSASCGNITISGGTIEATGSGSSAGIGSGSGHNPGDTYGEITISGGTITATGGQYGAGIGSGSSSYWGNINITGGTVTATGGELAAGIGSGNGYALTYGYTCGNISITGGTVTATGGSLAAGIGSGKGANCGTVTITDGVTSVTATKASDATNSIGAGNNGSCGTITIDPSLSDVTSGNTRTISHAPSVPTGAIDGLFSVSSTKQVYFSQGNLQYQASTGTWRFAKHQYDIIGGSNYLSESNTEWIDLYRWGTSGIDYTGHATLYRPWDFAYYSVYFNPYGSLTTNLYDGDGENAGKADWGYNAISNGGNTQNSGWRTLKNNTTDNEWQYIFNSRTTANVINSTSNARYTQARINIDDWAVRGIILFPDGSIGDTPSGVTWGTINAAASSWTTGTTQCTTAGWAALEAAGCVFLPAAGKYDDSGVGGADIDGYYWSSSYASDDNAYGMYFYSNEVNPQYSDARHYGLSVRLVKDAN